jgi:Glyoxalase-like domain
MLFLDHLTIIAPSLAEGVKHVRACLGIDMPYGATHPEMGTHNHRLRLGGEAYLEVIAADPAAPPRSGPRWFGLGRLGAVRSDWANGRRLRAWVARTGDIDAVLAVHGALFGGKVRIGQVSQFSLLPDGALPWDGALPSVIDRAGRPPPSAKMDDHGLRLRELVLEHPSPDEVAALYAKLEILNPPRVQEGASIRYLATIDTPGGIKTLT